MNFNPNILVYAIETHIYEEDQRARDALGLSSVTDANVKSAIRKAMGLGEGRPPKAPPKDPKEAWIASLATGIDRILKDYISQGLPRRKAADALKIVEDSLKTRREMTGGPRAYLDFLKRFLKDGDVN